MLHLLVFARQPAHRGLPRMADRPSAPPGARHAASTPGARVAPMAEPADCFAITAPGIEAVTAAELTALGASIDETEPGGVSFRADAALIYRANLELRTASRVLKRVAQFEARTWFELERHAKKIPWRTVLGTDMVPEFEVTSRKSKLYHNRGIAERLERVVGAGRKAAEVDPVARRALPGAGGARPVRHLRRCLGRPASSARLSTGDGEGTTPRNAGGGDAARMRLGRHRSAGRSVLWLGHHPDRGGAARAEGSRRDCIGGSPSRRGPTSTRSLWNRDPRRRGVADRARCAGDRRE